MTFYDDNGGIELASYERMLRTGSYAAESIQITVDEFDTGSWDTDEDGISNLDELITDPFLDEDA